MQLVRVWCVCGVVCVRVCGVVCGMVCVCVVWCVRVCGVRVVWCGVCVCVCVCVCVGWASDSHSRISDVALVARSMFCTYSTPPILTANQVAVGAEVHATLHYVDAIKGKYIGLSYLLLLFLSTLYANSVVCLEWLMPTLLDLEKSHVQIHSYINKPTITCVLIVL